MLAMVEALYKLKNPLVILVNNPVQSLNTLGFMLPACSSGNVVFPDENLLRTELAKTPVKDYVVSIDTIADVALSQAQKICKRSCILCDSLYSNFCIYDFCRYSYRTVMGKRKQKTNIYVTYIRKIIQRNNNANLCA